ncbi:MAG: MFS transporter [Pirellulales bacterium]
MANEADNTAKEGRGGAASADFCQLSARDQTVNVLVVAINTALSYLAAPVMYVDTVHAVLCKGLGASAFVYNLPGSTYLLFSAAPLFVGWLLPKASQLRPIIVTCYAGMAASTLLVGLLLMAPISDQVKIAMIILHGACTGIGRTVAVAGEFEVLGRAVSPSRRGRALGLAYGLGPILAIIGWLVGQLLLARKFGPLELAEAPFPSNYKALFLACTPALAIAALLATRLIIPNDDRPVVRSAAGPLGGLGEFLSRPVVLLSVGVAIMLASGATMISNLSTYAEVVYEQSADQFAGLLKTTQYGFKAVAGLGLGWLLSRTNPKTCVLASGSCILAAAMWAIYSPANTYILGFGLLGMGTLSGVYITNYMLYCATPDKIRRYMAFCMLAQVPCALAGQLLGWIKDQYPKELAERGFRASFLAAAAFVMVGLLLATRLPKRPQAEEAAG